MIRQDENSHMNPRFPHYLAAAMVNHSLNNTTIHAIETEVNSATDTAICSSTMSFQNRINFLTCNTSLSTGIKGPVGSVIWDRLSLLITSKEGLVELSIIWYFWWLDSWRTVPLLCYSIGCDCWRTVLMLWYSWWLHSWRANPNTPVLKMVGLLEDCPILWYSWWFDCWRTGRILWDS